MNDTISKKKKGMLLLLHGTCSRCIRRVHEYCGYGRCCTRTESKEFSKAEQARTKTDRLRTSAMRMRDEVIGTLHTASASLIFSRHLGNQLLVAPPQMFHPLPVLVSHD